MSRHGRSPRHRRKPKATEAAKAESTPVEAVGPVRIQKLLAAAGLASRRGAEDFIRDGRVTINGVVAQLGDRANLESDSVALDGEKLHPERPVYWMVNKPAGVVTTVRDPEGRATILDLIPERGPRVFPVGRLDKNTTGLVILTNNGALTQRLLHPSLGSEREYRVTVKGEVKEKTFRRLQKGIFLEGGMTSPAQVAAARFDSDSGTTTFLMILREGRKRQIRLSMLRLGHPVKKLVRVRMGPLRLGSLGRGEARRLNPSEITSLLDHAAQLKPTPRPPRKRRGSGRPKPR